MYHFLDGCIFFIVPFCIIYRIFVCYVERVIL